MPRGLAVADIEIVFLLNVASFAWSMLMVAGIHVGRAEEESKKAAEPESLGEALAEAAEEEVEQAEGFLRETSAGSGRSGGTRTCS